MHPKNYPVYIFKSLEIAKEKLDMDIYSYYILDGDMIDMTDMTVPIKEPIKEDHRKRLYKNKLYTFEIDCDGRCESAYECEYNEECKVTKLYSYEFVVKHVVEDIYKRDILYDTQKLEKNVPENAILWKEEFTK